MLKNFKIEYSSGIPVYKQLINHVSSLVGSGRLAAGAQLPSIREVTAALGINPNTVAKAYRELELQDIIETQRGRGCFVATMTNKVITAEEKQQILDDLYQKFCSEAAGNGVDEFELNQYIKNKGNEL